MTDPHPAPPPQGEARWHRLDPAVRMLWRVGAVFWAAFLTVAALALLLALDQPLRWALPVAVLALLHAAVVPGKRYEHFRYQVGDVELRIARGWLWRSTSVVLHSRVQHVDTRQGPVENLLGLATVVVFTAGSVGAMVAIPGLPHEDAEALRDRLILLSGTGDAV
jgi:uncharacterized protein